MRDEHLFRILGSAAILGGALRIGSSFIPWESGVAWIEALAFGIDVALVFGLMGIYLANRARLGGLGFAAFVVAETGVASIVGPDTTSFGIDTYQAGVAAIAIGLLLLSLVMLLKRAGSAPAAICWLASLVAGVVGSGLGRGEFGFFLGGMLFGLGFVAAGLDVVSPRDRF